MNTEIQKSFAIKLVGISIVAAVLWHVVVKPRTELVRELTDIHAIQINEIQHGEVMIRQQSAKVHSAIQRMSLTRDELEEQFDVHQPSDVHKHLQETAEAHGLTVSRIEPLRNSRSSRASGLDQGAITLATKVFRVECGGSYSDIVGYFEDLTNGTNIARIDSFRINPVSDEYTHLVLQVSVYQLTDVPEAFIESFSQSDADEKDSEGIDGEI